jgi:hypothetical protein
MAIRSDVTVPRPPSPLDPTKCETEPYQLGARKLWPVLVHRPVSRSRVRDQSTIASRRTRLGSHPCAGPIDGSGSPGAELGDFRIAVLSGGPVAYAPPERSCIHRGCGASDHRAYPLHRSAESARAPPRWQVSGAVATTTTQGSVCFCAKSRGQWKSANQGVSADRPHRPIVPTPS